MSNTLACPIGNDILLLALQPPKVLFSGLRCQSHKDIYDLLLLFKDSGQKDSLISHCPLLIVVATY